jgi:hypothetical protein
MLLGTIPVVPETAPCPYQVDRIRGPIRGPRGSRTIAKFEYFQKQKIPILENDGYFRGAKKNCR